MSSVECHACHKPLDFQSGAKIMRSDECSHCYANIHCCKMCDFYDKTAYNECRETNADRILEKESANFCDYFILNGASGKNGATKDELADAANSLFKD